MLKNIIVNEIFKTEKMIDYKKLVKKYEKMEEYTDLKNDLE